MAARASGCIVVVVSNAAAVPRAGIAAYGASKAAGRYQLQCRVLNIADAVALLLSTFTHDLRVEGGATPDA